MIANEPVHTTSTAPTREASIRTIFDAQVAHWRSNRGGDAGERIERLERLESAILAVAVVEGGIGKSHGYHGFLAFSHERSVVTNRIGIVDRLFPPYTPSVERMAVWTRRFFT